MNAKTDLENEMGETPLIVAIMHRQLRAVNLLRTCPVNIPDNYRQLHIHHAAAIDNILLVRRLVEAFPQALVIADINGNYAVYNTVRLNDRDVPAFFQPDLRCLERRNSFGMRPSMKTVAFDARDSFCSSSMAARTPPSGHSAGTSSFSPQQRTAASR